MGIINDIREDLRRYGKRGWKRRGFLCMLSYRLRRAARIGPWYYYPLKLLAVPLIPATYCTEIPSNCDIAPGQFLPHPIGVVIASGVKIGTGCSIYQNVTIGTKEGVPTIGAHSRIFAGAVVIGSIRIGRRVDVGANAVVMHDVPNNHIAVGVPAVVKPKGAVREEVCY